MSLMFNLAVTCKFVTEVTGSEVTPFGHFCLQMMTFPLMRSSTNIAHEK
jgi:hypothetical protein